MCLAHKQTVHDHWTATLIEPNILILRINNFFLLILYSAILFLPAGCSLLALAAAASVQALPMIVGTIWRYLCVCECVNISNGRCPHWCQLVWLKKKKKRKVHCVRRLRTQQSNSGIDRNFVQTSRGTHALSNYNHIICSCGITRYRIRMAHSTLDRNARGWLELEWAFRFAYNIHAELTMTVPPVQSQNAAYARHMLLKLRR